jgi:hypothetical protein
MVATCEKRLYLNEIGRCSIIARFGLYSFDSDGIGSSIATPGIIAVRCIRAKCEWLLVADEENHDQCQHREWCDKPWDDLFAPARCSWASICPKCSTSNA